MAEAAQAYGQPIAGHPGIRLVTLENVTTHEIQAAAEGVVLDEADTVTFFGETFKLAEGVSIMPMMEFALAAKNGLDSDDMAGLSAMYKLVRSVISRPPMFDENGQRQRDENGKMLRDEAEWNRFSTLAEDELADGDDIMAVVNQAMEKLSARPSKPREVSSASSRPISETSKPVLSSPVMPPQADGLTPVGDLGR